MGTLSNVTECCFWIGTAAVAEAAAGGTLNCTLGLEPGAELPLGVFFDEAA